MHCLLSIQLLTLLQDFCASDSFAIIGVGAQSTLGEDIFARKYVYEKLQNVRILHDI